MKEWLGHFEAVALYALAPLFVFSFMNAVVAYFVAVFAKLKLGDTVLLCLSFVSIGIATGLMVGLSRDSVVGAVLPALLTFVSSFAVYQFGKDAYQKWRPILPTAIFCLVLGTLCAAAFGASERNSFVEKNRRYEEWRIQYEKLEIPIQARILEKKFNLPTKPETTK
jgi:hypothetical protein